MSPYIGLPEDRDNRNQKPPAQSLWSEAYQTFEQQICKCGFVGDKLWIKVLYLRFPNPTP